MSNSDDKSRVRSASKLKDKNAVKKRVGAAVMAAVLTTNLAGGAVDEQNINLSDLKSTSDYIFEETMDMAPSESDIVLDCVEEKKKKAGRLSVKGLFVFAAGWLASICCGFFASVLTPVGAALLGWFLFAAGLFLSLVIIIRELFPDVSLKKIFNKKFFSFYVVILAVIIGVSQWLSYSFKKYVLWFKLLILFTVVVSILILIIKQKKSEK